MMFSEMLAELARGCFPDKTSLRQRFDMAMVKKMGVMRLPPAFWMSDPKINPRAEHLFWASLILRDPQRIELALAVLATEYTESERSQSHAREPLKIEVSVLFNRLLAQITDEQSRESFTRELQMIVPEWLDTKDRDEEKRMGRGH